MSESPTLEQLAAEIRELKQRVQELEDARDLRDLETAIEKNGSRPLTDWDVAKEELGL